MARMRLLGAGKAIKKHRILAHLHLISVLAEALLWHVHNHNLNRSSYWHIKQLDAAVMNCGQRADPSCTCLK